jgi:hypothetical protein
VHQYHYGAAEECGFHRGIVYSDSQHNTKTKARLANAQSAGTLSLQGGINCCMAERPHIPRRTMCVFAQRAHSINAQHLMNVSVLKVWLMNSAAAYE